MSAIIPGLFIDVMNIQIQTEFFANITPITPYEQNHWFYLLKFIIVSAPHNQNNAGL